MALEQEQEQVIQDEQPNETVENQDVEETDEEADVEVDSEEETDVDSTTEEESNEDTKETAKKDKPKQNADERKKFAEARRAREAKERKDIENKAYQKGVVQGLGGINPYTNEKIDSDVDFQLYQEMKKCEEKGLDPTNVKDFMKFRRDEIIAQQEETKKVSEQKEKINNDIKEFTSTHKEVNINELLKDEDFQAFSEDMLGVIPLNKIYDKYQLIQKHSEAQAKEIALKKEARKQTSTGSLNQSDTVEELFTLDQISKMSREEIEANWDKVKKSQRKFMN